MQVGSRMMNLWGQDQLPQEDVQAVGEESTSGERVGRNQYVY